MVHVETHFTGLKFLRQFFEQNKFENCCEELKRIAKSFWWVREELDRCLVLKLRDFQKNCVKAFTAKSRTFWRISFFAKIKKS